MGSVTRREELEKYPVYVAFGIDKLLRIAELEPLMNNIHKYSSDIGYVYRASRSSDDFIEKLKRHNYESLNMKIRNGWEIEEYMQLQAAWREHWKNWLEHENQISSEEGKI